tara:strand:- start:167 stop:448 length:282 start_codon:yes stop_codon:yes gene_type:complete
MNNQLKDMNDTIDQCIRELESVKEELNRNSKDLHKFYKRGSKRAGVRIRQSLKLLMDKAQALRMDIQRLYKEREIFKGTEFDKDYKRDKASPN